jgi:hypothetical protein
MMREGAAAAAPGAHLQQVRLSIVLLAITKGKSKVRKSIYQNGELAGAPDLGLGWRNP